MNNDLYFKYWNVFSSEYQSADFLSSNVKVDSRQVSLLIKLVTKHDLGIRRSLKEAKAKELENVIEFLSQQFFRCYWFI